MALVRTILIVDGDAERRLEARHFDDAPILQPAAWEVDHLVAGGVGDPDITVPGDAHTLQAPCKGLGNRWSKLVACFRIMGHFRCGT